MRRWLFSIAIITALCGAVSAPGVTIHKDAFEPATVVLEDFSGTNNPASAMSKVTLNSITNGAATYTYEASGTPEGTITYGTLATPLDASLYPSMRIRMAVDRDGAGSGAVQIYPTPIGSAGNVSMTVTSGTDLKETSFDLSATTADGNGIRLDAFNYANDATEDQFQIDYIMADLGRTIGFEFNQNGDFNGALLRNVSSSNVTDGVLAATAATGDPQIEFIVGGAPTINADIYKFVQIRMKGVAGDTISLFWNTVAKGSVTPSVTIDSSAESDGNYHTYLLDFSSETNWTGKVTTFRVDPSTTAAAAFEVDYVRFMEVLPSRTPEILFFDDFDDTVDNNPTNPAARATGTLADSVKYYVSGLTTNGEVAVTNGLLDWTGTNGANGDLEAAAANGTQNLQLSSIAGVNSAFDWGPYVTGKTYIISFTYRSAWSNPLNFGLSDTPTTGSWNADGVATYDYAFGAYGSNWQSGSDGVSSNSPSVTADTEYEIEVTINEADGLAEARVNGVLIVTRSINFENTGRYMTFGEPTRYGGYIDNLKISVIPSDAEEAVEPGFAQWAADNSLTGDDALTSADPDEDGMDNLLEYALGGNPQVNDAAALQPALMAMSDGGTNWFYYIQSRRTDDEALSYTVTLDDDLVAAPAGVTNAPIGQSAEVDGFTTFTNRTDLDKHEFFMLKVQKD
jgi:hypothetical protein